MQCAQFVADWVIWSSLDSPWVDCFFSFPEAENNLRHVPEG